MIRTILLIFALTTFPLWNAFSQSADSFFAEADTFFKTYVSNGRVDYKAINDEPEALNNLLLLAKDMNVSPSNAAYYQAFWINAYNLAVIKGIIDNYPTKSPLNIKGFFDKTNYSLGGKQTTLNDLENKLLRAVYPKEARFHFVLVCAGLGCPPIINAAYKPSSLEQQLLRQTTLALNDPNFIKVKGKKVQLSKIFEWYKEDFIHDGNEIEYINKFREDPIPANAKISYYTYDWNLNSK